MLMTPPPVIHTRQMQRGVMHLLRAAGKMAQMPAGPSSTRTAVADKMSFPNDKANQLRWIKTTTNYLIGRAGEMEHFLNWAEKFQSVTIGDYDIATLRGSPWVRKTDPERLSNELWTFLNLTFSNVSDRSALDNAKAGNGFDAWRRIVVPVGPRSEQRLHAMHNDVTRPNSSKRLADVERDLDKWESDLDEYYRCGGDRLGDRTKVLTAKTMLPHNTDAAVWLAIKNCPTYAEYRRVLRESIQYLIDHGVGSAARAHVLDEEVQDQPPLSPGGSSEWETVPAPEEFPAGTFANAEARDNYVLVMSKFQQRRLRQPTRKQQQTRTAAPPRSAEDSRCANCNQKGHTAQACIRPKVTMDQRRCHVCNKTGHLARACPDKDKAKANMIAAEPSAAAATREAFLGVIEDDHVGLGLSL